MKKRCRNIINFLLVFLIILSNNIFGADVEAKEQIINNKEQLLKLKGIRNNYVNGTVPYNIKITKDKEGQAIKKAIFLPTRYDLREHNKVTPIKCQGQIGNCWTFAAMASLESNLLITENKTYDFSEINMATHQYNRTADSGGNNMMAAAYFASWKGVVSEKDDPYPNPPSIQNVIKRDGIKPIKHVQEILFIPDRNSSTDNQQIKEAVYTKGAVATSINMDENYLDDTTGAYYYNGPNGTNHAITIVGWDDNYSKDNFNGIKPQQNGAFICKNSYGTWFGDNGYFYVSYYDKHIGKNNAVYTNAESVDNYSKIYQYDMYQYNMYYYAENSYYSNVFTVNNAKHSPEELVAASFYTIKQNTNYEVYVEEDYDKYGFSRIKNKKVKSGSIEMPGYHTIKLDTKIKVDNGKKFAISVKIDKDMAVSTLADNKSNFENSYMNYYGDVWTKMDNLVVCLKAFTNIEESKLKGDVDGSGCVNIKDVALVSKQYNKKKNMSGYNSLYDFNKDGIIDIYDLVCVSHNISR